MNPKTPLDEAKAFSSLIKRNKELMKSAGHEISDETAVLLQIYKEVGPQEVDRLGQKLAKIDSTLTAMLAALQEIKNAKT